MTTFETILCCILIPVAFVLVYIAGKNDILNLIGEMIKDATDELKARRAFRKSLDYPTLRKNDELFDEEIDELFDESFLTPGKNGEVKYVKYIYTGTEWVPFKGD